jgi:hypothetical protein
MNMTPPDNIPSREDVLGAFAVEADHGRATLERYLRDYPQYAEDLIDLSAELALPVEVSTAPLAAEEQAVIDAAWQRHAAAGPAASASPLARLTVGDIKSLAQQLSIPRQVLAGLREHRALVASIPEWLLKHLAALVDIRLEEFKAALARAPALAHGRQYKAHNKPAAPVQVTFEQLLIDAGVPPDKRAALLAERD